MMDSLAADCSAHSHAKAPGKLCSQKSYLALTLYFPSLFDYEYFFLYIYSYYPLEHALENVVLVSRLLKILLIRDFPGGTVVKTSPSNAGGAGSIPGWEL